MVRVGSFTLGVVILSLPLPAMAQERPAQGPPAQVQPAAGQPHARATSESSRAASGVVATGLPFNLARLHQRLRESESRPAGNGIVLSFTVHVVEPAPKLQLFTPADNLRWGQPRWVPPIHQEMLRIVSPPWVRH